MGGGGGGGPRGGGGGGYSGSNPGCGPRSQPRRHCAVDVLDGRTLREVERVLAMMGVTGVGRNGDGCVPSVLWYRVPYGYARVVIRHQQSPDLHPHPEKTRPLQSVPWRSRTQNGSSCSMLRVRVRTENRKTQFPGARGPKTEGKKMLPRYPGWFSATYLHFTFWATRPPGAGNRKIWGFKDHFGLRKIPGPGRIWKNMNSRCKGYRNGEKKLPRYPGWLSATFYI